MLGGREYERSGVGGGEKKRIRPRQFAASRRLPPRRDYLHNEYAGQPNSMLGGREYERSGADQNNRRRRNRALHLFSASWRLSHSRRLRVSTATAAMERGILPSVHHTLRH